MEKNYFQLKELLTKVPADHMSKPILKARLSEKQWENVKYINQALSQEYECRREMLLKRLDVTIQSFKWSDKAKVSNFDQIHKVHMIRFLIYFCQL